MRGRDERGGGGRNDRTSNATKDRMAQMLGD